MKICLLRGDRCFSMMMNFRRYHPGCDGMCHGIDHHANDMYHMDILMGRWSENHGKLGAFFRKKKIG